MGTDRGDIFCQRLWIGAGRFRKDVAEHLECAFYTRRFAFARVIFFWSYLYDGPELVDLVLRQKPEVFQSSNRIRAGLKPLLGEMIFISNGPLCAIGARVIDLLKVVK